MKKRFLFLSMSAYFFSGAQVFNPVAVTGFTLDAVAENTTALSTTGGVIDGSNYVMYSVAYGVLYSTGTGLPNSGLISVGTRTYQLQPYTQNNLLYIPGGQVDSLQTVTPASYGALSIAGFATEGTGNLTATVRFTDNSTQVYTGISLPDWFVASTTGTILTGFDRCSRPTGTPNNQTVNPKMFSFELTLNCANRLKQVKTVKFQNTTTGARLCIMAMSASGVPTFTAATSPVSCTGGSNGSATINPGGGIGPYNYTINSTPTQNTGNPVNLPTGAYSYTAVDAAACPVFGGFNIALVPAPQPPINLTVSTGTVCAGATVTVTAAGAATYTWNIPGNTNVVSVTPANTTTYLVSGHSSGNCLLTGSAVVTVNQLPIVSISGLPASICKNSAPVTITPAPPGGVLTGPGLTTGPFDPSGLVPGTYTLNYSYTDGNNCTATTAVTSTVNAVPVTSFTTVAGICLNAATITLLGLPIGGSFTGPGVSGAVFSPTIAGVGTAAIMYSYTDPNNCTGTKTASVTVHSLPVVTFSMTKTFFCVNASSAPLNATAPGIGTFSGPGVSTSFFVPSQAGNGTHTIVYSYTDLNSCTVQKSQTVTVSGCTGIGENAAPVLRIYPNPNNGAFTIDADDDVQLTIFDQLGREVSRFAPGGGKENQANVEGLAAGIYYAVVVYHDQTSCQKIVVTH